MCLESTGDPVHSDLKSREGLKVWISNKLPGDTDAYKEPEQLGFVFHTNLYIVAKKETNVDMKNSKKIRKKAKENQMQAGSALFLHFDVVRAYIYMILLATK